MLHDVTIKHSVWSTMDLFGTQSMEDWRLEKQELWTQPITHGSVARTYSTQHCNNCLQQPDSLQTEAFRFQLNTKCIY